jgi:hypothetical protein
MNDLLRKVLESHSGLARWNKFSTVRVQIEVREIDPITEGQQVWPRTEGALFEPVRQSL